MPPDVSRILVFVTVLISIVFLILPFSQKMAVSNFLSPVLLLPVNSGNKIIANFVRLQANLERAEERANHLALENKLLIEKIKTREDSVLTEIREYNLISARIIARDLVTMNHLLFLDKGAEAGIQKQSPVVYLGCLVGKIIDVGHNRSTVFTMLHPGFHVSSKVKRTGIFCMTTATSDRLIANYVEKEADIMVGDTMISSGLSDVIPAGLYIARVVRMEEGADMFFKKVYLRPIAEISKLEKVYIMIPTKKRFAPSPGADLFKDLKPRPPKFPP
ncbi:MAG: rod shape-determining protein MreC [candidate division WOR-3 bacterium]